MTWSSTALTVVGVLAAVAIATACDEGAPVTRTSAAPAATAAAETSTSAPDADQPAGVPPAATSPTAAATPAREQAVAAAASGTALAVLGQLEVKGRTPRTGYDRELFGQSWADVDRNGCDTRNDILRRDLTNLGLKEGTNGCVVLSGILTEPFAGATIAFERGEQTSQLVQIDHVVALSDAWQKGAQQWAPQRRVAFANDPLNLLAVDGALNAEKSDGDAATWLPPNRSFRCSYVARQVAVKAKYGAWVTAAERDAVARVLADCPDQPLPASDAPTESSVGAPAAASTAPRPAPQQQPAPAPAAPGAAPAPPAAAPAVSCDTAYPGVCIAPYAEAGDLDCGDVSHRRFAVRTPDPHGFDGDSDGVGCES